jgi:hypothetical protein
VHTIATQLGVPASNVPCAIVPSSLTQLGRSPGPSAYPASQFTSHEKPHARVASSPAAHAPTRFPFGTSGRVSPARTHPSSAQRLSCPLVAGKRDAPARIPSATRAQQILHCIVCHCATGAGLMRAPRSQQLVAQLPSGARGNLLQATPFRLSPSFPASSPNRSAERQRRFSCAVSAQSTRKTTRASPEGLAVAMSDRLLLRCRPLAATLSARNLARGTGEQDQRRAARRPARRVPNTPRTQRRPRDYPSRGRHWRSRERAVTQRAR